MLIPFIAIAAKLPLPVAQTSMIDTNPTLQQICGLIKKSIARCEQHHSLCRDRVRDTSSTFSPKRLLHLSASRIRIVEDPKIDKWACLSYCWGTLPDPLKLTRHELNAFKLEIPSARLPQLFKDVAQVCQLLDVNYIWIDALCIVQDSDTDWIEQAGQMARIYAEGTFTIAAEDALDPSQALVKPVYERPAWIPLETHEGIFFRKFVDERRFGSDRGNNVLAKRAWTYQEIQLSPRLIRLKKEDILWECPQTGNTHFQQEHQLRSQRASLNRLLSRPDSQQDMATRAHGLWRRLVEEYTSRQLTFPSDKMAAFAAIAEKFGDLFQMNDEFCMGFWQSWLLEDLEWHREERKPSTRILYRRSAPCSIPSWSWASVNTSIKLGRLGVACEATPGVDSMARIINKDTAYFGSPYLGLALKARITVEVPFLEVQASSQKCRSSTLSAEPSEYFHVRILNVPQIFVKGNSMHLSDLVSYMGSIFDVDDESPKTTRRPDEDEKFIIAMFTVTSGHAVTGLWLRKVSGWPLRYRRIGVCDIAFRSQEVALRESNHLWNGHFVPTLRGASPAAMSIGRAQFSRNVSRMTEEQRAQLRAETQRETEFWKNLPIRQREERGQLREVLSSVPRRIFTLE